MRLAAIALTWAADWLYRLGDALDACGRGLLGVGGHV